MSTLLLRTAFAIAVSLGILNLANAQSGQVIIKKINVGEQPGAEIQVLAGEGKNVQAGAPKVIAVEAEVEETPKPATGKLQFGKEGKFEIEIGPGPAGKFTVGPKPITEKLSEYYLGLQCVDTIDDALRAQLDIPKGTGLLVESVVPKSPAATSGFQPHDVVLRANDKELTAIADLVTAVDAAKGNGLKLTILRKGQKQTLGVQPAKRGGVEIEADIRKVVPGADASVIMKWMQDFQKEGDQGPVRIRAFAPGVTVGQARMGALSQLPKDVTVVVTHEGAAPAKIVIKQGKEEWSATEDSLEKLPEIIQGYVGPLVGRWDLLRFRTDIKPSTIQFQVNPDGKPSKSESKSDDKIGSKSSGDKVAGKLIEGKNTSATVDQRLEEMQRRAKEMQDQMQRHVKEMQDQIRDLQEAHKHGKPAPAIEKKEPPKKQ